MIMQKKKKLSKYFIFPKKLLNKACRFLRYIFHSLTLSLSRSFCCFLSLLIQIRIKRQNLVFQFILFTWRFRETGGKKREERFKIIFFLPFNFNSVGSKYRSNHKLLFKVSFECRSSSSSRGKRRIVVEHVF